MKTFLEHNYYNKGAGVIITTIDGMFLMCQENTNFKYTFPQGKCDDDEYVFDTAIRELEEETNIKYNDIESDIIYQNCILHTQTNNTLIRERYLYHFILKKELKDYSFDLKCNSFFKDNKPEIVNYQWFDFKNINIFRLPILQYSIKNFIKYNYKTLMKNL